MKHGEMRLPPVRTSWPTIRALDTVAPSPQQVLCEGRLGGGCFRLASSRVQIPVGLHFLVYCALRGNVGWHPAATVHPYRDSSEPDATPQLLWGMLL